ncbi:MAG: DEAD/DEAH box helicase [Pyramidobacter sp.]|nr:DEAD/DEAH box helicase [Pyramidobacter sp.]
MRRISPQGTSNEQDRASLAVRELCGRGLFEEALKLRDSLSDYDRCWLNAVDSLVRGQLREAKKNFDRWLRRARRIGGELSDAADPWELLYIPLLAALSETPAKIVAAARRCSNRTSWLEGGLVFDAQAVLAFTNEQDQRRAFHSSEPISVISKAAESALNGEGTADPERTFRVFLKRLEKRCSPMVLTHLFFLCFWAAPDLAKRWLILYEPLARLLSSEGQTFFASELCAVADAIAGRSAVGSWRPIRDLLRAKPAWEKSLDALESLAENGGSAPRKRGERRLIWTVAWDRCAPDDPDDTRIIPFVSAIEQTLGASGAWSKGRTVAASTIAKGFDRIPDLPDADRRVRDAVREYGGYGYYGPTVYELDDCKALSLLVGHPSVVRAGDFAPLEIVRGEVRLEARDGKEGCTLRMTPERLGDQSVVIEEESPTRLRVSEYSPAQLDLASVIGHGLTIPSQGRARMLKALSRLTGTVAVQSDAAELEASLPERAADGTLYARLSPCGDGLTAEFVTRPFGPEGMSCRPGGGAAVLVGTVRDEDGSAFRTRVRRDLAAETAKLRVAVETCPALLDGDDEGGAVWTLSDPETCLELLLQLKNVPGLRVEWPRGGAMTVRTELNSSALLGAAQTSGKEWFTLSGTVKVDKELTLTLRQLISLVKSRKSRFVEIGEGQFVALTREFERRVQMMAALCDDKSGELRVPPLAAPAVNELFAPDALVSDAGWASVCKRFDEALALKPEAPRTLKAELRPYQLEGYRWLSRLAHCGAGACLADEMGLGKTVQTLALLLERAPEGPALIVAPTSVCGNWRDEAARFAPTLNVIDYRTSGREKSLEQLGPFDAVLVSYGLLQSDAELFARREWDTIVLDEAQAVKNMATKRSAAVMDLKGGFRMIMTGTPVENRLSELWNLFRFLNPGLLGSLERFNRLFASPVAEGDERARARMRRVVAPFLLRRTKDQVLDDLPPRTDVTLRIDLSERERAFYEALRQNAADAVASSGNENSQDARFVIFAQLMKLRRCCCAVSLTEEGAALASGIPSSKTAALLELASQLHAEGHRALVFSQFTDHLALVRTALEDAGFECLYLDGSTPAAKRSELVAQFQAGSGDFFLISLRAGGTGLNLTGADYVIHMDPWWNPAVEDQASDRAHRIGQKRPVTVYRLVARGTVEEKIVDLHRAKRDLARDVLDGAGSPASLDLRTLAALLRDEP